MTYRTFRLDNYRDPLTVEYQRAGETEWGHSHDESPIKFDDLRLHCRMITSAFGTACRIRQGETVVYETPYPRQPGK